MLTDDADQIRILIVDDHQLLSTGLRLIIESQPHMRVVGEVMDRAAALQVAADTQPDIILLDIDLGADSGYDLLPELSGVAPHARVIVITGLRDPEEQRRAVMLGAMGLVQKEQGGATILKAIEKVHAGEVWLDRMMIANVLQMRARGASVAESTTATRIALLTDREREVIRLVGEGLKNREIAGRLLISEATVRHHLTSIFSKLGVADRFELVVFAFRHRLAQLRR